MLTKNIFEFQTRFYCHKDSLLKQELQKKQINKMSAMKKH